MGGQSLYKLFLGRKHSVAQESDFFSVGSWVLVGVSGKWRILVSLFEDAAVFFRMDLLDLNCSQVCILTKVNPFLYEWTTVSTSDSSST